MCRAECLVKHLQEPHDFFCFADAKPCYVRAMEICSTFSAANPMNMVAWSGIEPLTRGFSKHVAPKSSMFVGLAGGFRVTCYRPCYTKTTLFCTASANTKSTLPQLFASVHFCDAACAAEWGVAIHHLKSTSTPPQKTAAQFFVGADPFQICRPS